jgi:hypothetical protein
MLRSTNIQREIAKKMMLKTGEFVSLAHITGTPTWTGDYDQTPVYTSSTSTVICRAVPVREEITIQEQIFGVGDVHAFFSYDTSIDIHDEVTFSGTSLFSGSYVVNWCGYTETSTETFLKRQDG